MLMEISSTVQIWLQMARILCITFQKFNNLWFEVEIVLMLSMHCLAKYLDGSMNLFSSRQRSG